MYFPLLKIHLVQCSGNFIFHWKLEIIANNKHHTFHLTPNIIWLTKPRTRMVGHATHMGEIGNTSIVLLRKPEENQKVGRP